MRLKAIVASAMLVTGLVFGSSVPASAAGTALLADGDITVYDDLTACATVSFNSGTAFAGSFEGVGEVQGDGTKVGTIRGARAISDLNGGTWSGCIAGAYAGATAGEAKFVLHASGVNGGDVVYVVQCTVMFGNVSCV